MISIHHVLSFLITLSVIQLSNVMTRLLLLLVMAVQKSILSVQFRLTSNTIIDFIFFDMNLIHAELCAIEMNDIRKGFQKYVKSKNGH